MGVGRLDMLSRATVAVSAGANFVVEGAVHFVGFSAENAGEVVGHFVCGFGRRRWVLGGR